MVSFEEIWDKVVEEFEYFISFEWFGDIGDFFSGLFESLGELSIPGLIFGVISLFLTHMVLKKLIFITSQPLGGRILYSGIMYLFSFALTYIMTKRVFDM